MYTHTHTRILAIHLFLKNSEMNIIYRKHERISVIEVLFGLRHNINWTRLNK
jgi:hypothetical protein